MTARYFVTWLCVALLTHAGVAAASVDKHATRSLSLTTDQTADETRKSAKTAMGKQEYDKAVELLSNLIQKNPDDVEAHFLRGIAYIEKRDFDKAISDLNDAIRLDPEYGDFYYVRARAYAAKRDAVKALADYDRAIELKPNMSAAIVERGFLHGLLKKLDKAHADFSEAIKLDPKHPMGYFGRGNIYVEKKEHAKAVADFSRVIELDPKHVGAFVFRGNALAKMKSYANATQDFQSVIKLAPEDSEGYNSLAWLLATCPEEGFRDAKKAIELAKKACTLSSYEEPRPLDTGPHPGMDGAANLNRVLLHSEDVLHRLVLGHEQVELVVLHRRGGHHAAVAQVVVLETYRMAMQDGDHAGQEDHVPLIQQDCPGLLELAAGRCVFEDRHVIRFHHPAADLRAERECLPAINDPFLDVREIV